MSGPDPCSCEDGDEDEEEDPAAAEEPGQDEEALFEEAAAAGAQIKSKADFHRAFKGKPRNRLCLAFLQDRFLMRVSARFGVFSIVF